MDFSLTEEQLMVQEAARDYTQREIVEDVIERNEKAEFPLYHVEKLKDLGFFGMMVNSEYYGGGMDTISYCLALEEFAKVDPSIATIVSEGTSEVQKIVISRDLLT